MSNDLVLYTILRRWDENKTGTLPLEVFNLVLKVRRLQWVGQQYSHTYE
jgi:hypothetical protein